MKYRVVSRFYRVRWQIEHGCVKVTHGIETRPCCLHTQEAEGGKSLNGKNLLGFFQQAGLLQAQREGILPLGGPTGFAFRNPLMQKQPPDPQQPGGNANPRARIAGMRTYRHRHAQEMPDQCANPPRLLVVFQFQHFHRGEDVIRQNRQRIERLIGQEVFTGRMM